MGIVTKHLIERIRGQVEEHGIVVWFDPQGAYAGVVDGLAWPGTAIHRYEDSFIALRFAVDALLNDEGPPRLVVYVPQAENETHYALVELIRAGVVMRPGQQPPERNTALAMIARDALGTVFPPEAVAEITQQVTREQLNLADLDHLAEQGTQVQTGALAVIFGSGSAAEVALAFLSDEGCDAAILEKRAVPDLVRLLAEAYGADLPGDEPPASIRLRLARHVLLTDFVVALGDAAPDSLRSARVPTDLARRAACTQLAHSWRQRRDLAETYIQYAAQVEAELGLKGLNLPLEAWQRTETFAVCEQRLQEQVEAALVERAEMDWVALARRRQAGFWAEVNPGEQARWALIATAGDVLHQAQRVEQGLRARTNWKSEQLVRAYAVGYRPSEGEAPWCLLDTAHRHLERRYYNFDLRPEVHATLEQLVALARQRYAAVANTLAERFSRALQRDRFDVPGVMMQTDIYQTLVAPQAEEVKTAYVLVDALRFEIARELAHSLGEECQSITPALAALPTLTGVGMTALLPGAERGLSLYEASSGIGVQVNGQPIRTRADRVRWLKDSLGEGLAVVKLEDLVPARRSVQRALEAAQLVVVTSQEIDALAEGGNVPLARRTMDDVPHLLRRAFRSLNDYGVGRIVIAADHGYIFDEAESGMKLDPPGGQMVELHRRAWIGYGGERSSAYLRVDASELGLGGDLELAFPWNLAVFKVRGGSRAYFHGGLSLQEMVIGVLEVGVAAAAPAEVSRVIWTLRPGSPQISTRFLSVTVAGESQELLPITPPRVRVEVRAGAKVISAPISASYGFEETTGDVVLCLAEGKPRKIEPNTVTLMIVQEIAPQTVSVCLMDATTGVGLTQPVEVPLDIPL
jgi:hypothetical protein